MMTNIVQRPLYQCISAKSSLIGGHRANGHLFGSLPAWSSCFCRLARSKTARSPSFASRPAVKRPSADVQQRAPRLRPRIELAAFLGKTIRNDRSTGIRTQICLQSRYALSRRYISAPITLASHTSNSQSYSSIAGGSPRL